MKAKLELKHWLAYSGRGCLVYGASDLFELRSAVPYGDEIELHLYHPVYGNCTGDSIDYDLVLRPFWCITQEIEINGEKFVPVDKLREDAGFYYNKSRMCDVISNIHHLKNQMFYYDKLIDWNIDVYNLIQRNLAIDINTLNK